MAMKLFSSIGFEIKNDDVLDDLAEYVGNSGQRTSIYRRGAFIHGRCLALGNGIEVWTTLYEDKVGIYFADCRPAFRSLRVYRLSPWELTEYDEDGGAILTGTFDGTELPITFELQNLTEINQTIFNQPELYVAIAALAYKVELKQNTQQATKFLLTEKPQNEDYSESEYEICGAVLGWRQLKNEITERDIWIIEVDTGTINLEILINKTRLKGNLTVGAILLARVWLQGHLLDARLMMARYEGVDREIPHSQLWSIFRRDN